jgi:hypothetical protein
MLLLGRDGLFANAESNAGEKCELEFYFLFKSLSTTMAAQNFLSKCHISITI